MNAIGLKINDYIALRDMYGSDMTLGELSRKAQGNRVCKCPKCRGRGCISVLAGINVRRCDDAEPIDVECDFCDGEGYVERECKTRMV